MEQIAPTSAPVVPKQKRGFAVMSPEKRAEISRKGGIKVHALGKAYKFSSEKAAEAGSKGAKALQAKRAAAKETQEPAVS